MTLTQRRLALGSLFMKQLLFVSLTSICLAFFSSCGSEAEAKLCGSCGQNKDTAECCAEGADKCETCSKHKDSPGCCK